MIKEESDKIMAEGWQLHRRTLYQVTSQTTRRTVSPILLRAAYPLGLICSELATDPPDLRTSVWHAAHPPSTIKLGRNLTRLRNLTLDRKLTLGRNLTPSRKLTLKIHQRFRVNATLPTAMHPLRLMRNLRRANGLSICSNVAWS